MPIINGQKMACAPCIRGHRSTKCNHFYERVMVPVRKPGRPLSTCPCPPGRPCSCGGVRVAIPKKQMCKCPTETADAANGSEKEQSPVETPTSPSRPSFRVGKSNAGSKANSRKQSFDPVNLQRMDPGSINFIAAPNNNGVTNGMSVAGSPNLQGPQADLTGLGAGIGLIPAGSGNTFAPSPNPNYGASVPYGLGLQYAQPNQFQHAIKVEDSGLISPPNGNFGAAMPPSPYVNGSHTPSSISGTPQLTMLEPSRTPKTPSITSGGGSCCGGKAKEPSRPNNVPVSNHGYGQPYMPQYQSENIKPQSVHSFQYPTVFTYPADIGSWQHPIDPAIWQQMLSQTSMPLSTSMPSAANGDAENMGASHECSCGEGCQCVGCLAHPFNAQMFQYVNNAYGGSNGSSPGAGGANGAIADGAAEAGGHGRATAAGAGHESPPEAPTPTPSDGSPPREEQSLSTLDYFFVNLPISGLCEGSVESCPCGDSCACPGCLVHGSAVPV